MAMTILDNAFGPGGPETRLDRMLMMRTVGRYGPHTSDSAGAGWDFLQKTVRGLPNAERVSIYAELAAGVIYGGTRRGGAHLRHTDGEYWRILNFHFIEGRPYSEADSQADRGVVVISEALRDQLFGNQRVVGLTVNVGDRAYTIVGVVWPVAVTRGAAYSQMWAPIGPINSEERTQFLGRFNAVVLARRSADIPALQREFQARVKRFPLDDPKEFTELRAALDTPL